MVKKIVRSCFQRLEFLQADSSAELVQELNRTARIPKESEAEYMRLISTMLASRDDGLDVRHSSAEAFVADLKAHARIWQVADNVYIPLF